MMHSISLSFIPNRILGFIKRNLKSALYITGDKAQQMFVAVHPYVDFEKRLSEKENLVENICRRCLSIDLEKIIDRYYFFKTIEEKKIILETTRDEINSVYSEVIKELNTNIEEVNKLKLHKHVVKEELKSLKEYLFGLEENVMISILNLPNDLHELAPEKDQVIYEFLKKPLHESESHIDIGSKLNYIRLVENWGCYLMSDAALFEIAISNYAVKTLISSNYVQFQNADFSRSVIVEGCGTGVINNAEILTLYETKAKNQVLQEFSRLHLTGSASTYAFMAYFAKHLVQHTQFPLRYFCHGRSYNGNLRNNDDLFNLNQESSVNIFIATVDHNSFETFEEITEVIKKIYDNLGYHYRLVHLEPSGLDKSESLRLSVQMFSSHLQKYIEVGYLSYYGSYISERLLFCCVQNKEQTFPKIIGGNILDIQKVLGCVLENASPSNNSVLNEFLRQHLPL